MRSADRKLVFIVDDERTLREIYSTLVEEEGSEVVTFDSAEDALTRIPELRRPNLLLLDFTLPGMSGVEFLHSLAGRVPDFRKSAVVAGFSNHGADRAEVAEFLKVVDTYFEKPTDIEWFLRKVRELLARTD